MSLRPISIALATVIGLPAQALAHTGTDHAAGLMHGLAHPIAGADHLLAMAAIGMIAVHLGGRWLWALPVLFLGGMVLGGVLGMAGLGLPGVEPGILASVVLLGGLLCLAPGATLAPAILLAAISGLVHGNAHGTELPTGGSAVAYTAGFILATAALHLAGIGAGISVRQTMKARAARFAGIAIATTGVGLAALAG